MEVTELEEGEARFDDNDDNIDPDIAFSYIDKRLENVMGHFQKVFEGLVSAELLGPLYGKYGSFLPTQKHPPTHSHSITPPKALTSNKPFSFDNILLEGASLDPVTPVGPVLPATTSHHKNVVLDQNALSVNDPVSKDVTKNEITASNLGNPSEKRSLKVRIKVGNNNKNKSTRRNDEIYSGLGLSSSSSSMGNNLEDSCGPSIESHDLFLNSPETILRDMTSVFVPGNRLLSPLNESLFCLPKMEMKTNSSIFVDEKKPMVKKEANLQEKSEVLEGMKCKSSISFENKSGLTLTNDSKGKLLSDSVITSEPNQAVKKFVPVKKRETKRELIEDKLFSPDITSNQSDEQKNIKIRESNEVKVSQSIDKQPFARKSKLIGVQNSGILKEKSKSKSSLFGSMKDKKIALKDIVKVRNSYKDILDTNVDDQNIQTKPLEMPAGNEAVHIAAVAVPQQTAVGPAPQDNWAGCDRCEKWRLLPIGIDPENLPEKWLCSMSTWLPGRNSCDVSEDETTRAVQEINLNQLISQNQNNLQVNNVNFDQMNSNVHSEIMVNRLKKNISRYEGSNQLLVEKIAVNKPVDVEKHAAKVNGGDSNPKKLKRKTGSDQYDSVTSNKIKTECEPRGNLVISVKKESESSQISMQNNKLLDKMHGKKRKLKDGQESQPLENCEDRIRSKEKRLKTDNNSEVNVKVKTMKIRLSVDPNHEKDKFREKVTCKKDFATTSSSSRRISLQGRKGSPVGSVSSSPKRSLNRIKSGPAIEIPKSQRLGGNSQHIVKHDKNGAISSGKDNYKDEKPSIQRVKVKASDPLTGQQPFLKKNRKVEADKISTKHSESESKSGDSEMSLNVKRDLKKVFVENSKKKEVETKTEASRTLVTTSLDGSGQNKSKAMKHPEDSSDCGPTKALSITSFLKEYSSSQTALTALKRAEESKAYAERLKASGFEYECADAYFDSALKFLYAASLLEACTADVSKSMNVYSTSAKLFKICGEEYEKRKEMGGLSLAYKCIEVACMRIIYCKSLATKQDLQTSMQMVTQGESPSSSASDVDNLNNQATTALDKTMLSKSIGNQFVARNQANFTRLLDFTNDASLAMEASMKSQKAYKSALEQDHNKEMIVSVKRVVDFSFQDVKEIICLVQNAREAINRRGFKGSRAVNNNISASFLT